MAESSGKGVLPEEVEPISELKKELQRAVEALVEEDEDDCDLAVTDNAIRTLCALKDLKLKQSDKEYVKLGNLGFQEPPPEFRCPISGILMQDPVVTATGQTYESKCIQQWLEDGNQTCPLTEQVLPHNALSRNHLVRKMILDWCKEHQVDMPGSNIPVDEEYTSNIDDDREYLVEMLRRIASPNVYERMVGAREIRLLTYRYPSFRELFDRITGSIHLLMDAVHTYFELREDLIAAIFHISTDERIRNKIVEDLPSVIAFLIESLRGESPEIRRHAAAGLYTISMVDSSKHHINELGGVRYLIKFMDEAHLLALKDAALAILNICTVVEIREKAISDSAVLVVAEKIKGGILIDEMLDILAMLSRHHRAIEQMDEQGMIQCLFNILNESTTSEQNKEHCVAIIHAMCFSDRAILRKVDIVDKGYETLSQVARTGTSRAKRKSASILDRLSKFAFSPHSA